MSDYKELLERVPEIRDRIPGVKERMIAIVQSEMQTAFVTIDNALNVEINAMIKDLNIDASDAKLLEQVVKSNGIEVNKNIIKNLYSQFDAFEIKDKE